MSSDFIETWKEFGYQDGMGSSTFLPPPPRNFVRAYHMTSRDYAERAITKSRLKVARFSEVNDPFELLALNCHTPAARKLTKGLLRSQDSKTGLLSFTANWKNPLLWSHYADKHRGICLGFDLLKSTVETVEYVDTRVRPELTENGPTYEIPASVRNRLCRMKSSVWSYEEELRVLIPLKECIEQDGLHFLPFGEKMKLAEVIIGPRCEGKIETIKKLTISSPEVVVFKARLAFRSFAVVVDGRTKPQVNLG